jgi:hypothetical protein
MKYINRDHIKVASLPRYTGLTIEALIDFAKAHDDLKTYLPDEQDWVHLDKQWIADVLYTMDQDGIELMIAGARKQRRDKMEQKKHEIIEMKPEFAQALQVCINFTGKHTSHQHC